MYAGSICEQGTADEIFYNPRHEYTKGLMRSIPTAAQQRSTAPAHYGYAYRPAEHAQGLPLRTPVRRRHENLPAAAAQSDGH